MKQYKPLIITLLVLFTACRGSYDLGDMMLEDLQREHQNIGITNDGNDYIFTPLSDIRAGIAFYPGGKVDYLSYAPMLAQLADSGYLCKLYHMPADLAIWDTHAAHKFKSQYPECPKHFIGGHSLGGAAAAMCLNKHRDRFDGIFFLAAYSNKDIHDYDGVVVSIYGTEDKVLNMEKYNGYKSNLPSDYQEFVIEGGCHSFFGYYGMQEGDGTPTITRKEQMDATISILTQNLR